MFILAASPLVIFVAGPVPGLGVAGGAWAIVGYNVAMAAVLLRAVAASGSPTSPGFRSLFHAGVTPLRSCASPSQVRPAR